MIAILLKNPSGAVNPDGLSSFWRIWKSRSLMAGRERRVPILLPERWWCRSSPLRSLSDRRRCRIWRRIRRRSSHHRSRRSGFFSRGLGRCVLLGALDGGSNQTSARDVCQRSPGAETGGSQGLWSRSAVVWKPRMGCGMGPDGIGASRTSKADHLSRAKRGGLDTGDCSDQRLDGDAIFPTQCWSRSHLVGFCGSFQQEEDVDGRARLGLGARCYRKLQLLAGMDDRRGFQTIAFASPGANNGSAGDSFQAVSGARCRSGDPGCEPGIWG